MQRVTVKEAAERLGCHATTIQQGLRNGSFPVGCAVRRDTGRFTYIIPRPAFENFLTTYKGMRHINIKVYKHGQPVFSGDSQRFLYDYKDDIDIVDMVEQATVMGVFERDAWRVEAFKI